MEQPASGVFIDCGKPSLRCVRNLAAHPEREWNLPSKNHEATQYGSEYDCSSLPWCTTNYHVFLHPDLLSSYQGHDRE
jgi:hypothetical protein